MMSTQTLERSLDETGSAAVRSTNPIFGPNKLKLGIFGLNGKGTANTLVPEAHRPEWPTIIRAAQMADAAGLEAIVAYSRWKGHELGKLDHPSGVVLDPFTWAAGVAQATRHSAVFATSHAPTIHPVTAAKMCATIDIISGGRFGLNVVAGWNRPELEMFGAPLKEHEERYAHLEEWLNIVKRLWSEDEEFDFEGGHFKIVRGGSRPKPVQRPHPPIMSAGSSGTGREFALRSADMCFVQLASTDPAERRAHVDSYKQLAREKYGRDVKVWVMGNIVQRDTNAEAEAYVKHFAIDHADKASIDAWIDMQNANSKALSRPDLDARRRRAGIGAGGTPIIGDADRVAEQLEALSDCGVDGLLIGFVDFADGITRLTQGVLPQLEAKGLRQKFSLPAAQA
ncbi:LLM class flavin-dependent oxidoreductase [Caballeronia sp. LZ035]|uniref:LLM class flavin-dependent oxidoreductase n=1 Tax=Caballeronia sp. LZ035 TaxID=3038568 RepID=UPI00285C2D3F|nr:LLM class flavin-dependent oxidoreductase [Caballeronia sp. LZ035]MDR5759646.1 LLM class flavin-dependent oxidoreductase [Caballeronia sp. LZ035]